jgi:hypothetical protein
MSTAQITGSSGLIEYSDTYDRDRTELPQMFQCPECRELWDDLGNRYDPYKYHAFEIKECPDCKTMCP